jgi:hypothetical protein
LGVAIEEYLHEEQERSYPGIAFSDLIPTLSAVSGQAAVDTSAYDNPDFSAIDDCGFCSGLDLQSRYIGYVHKSRSMQITCKPMSSTKIDFLSRLITLTSCDEFFLECFF